MANGDSTGPVVCPGCRTWENTTVEQARTDQQGRRENLHTRLATAPQDTGMGLMHFCEGLVLAVIAGAAGAYYADERDMPWLTAAGAAAAVLILVATLAIVRDGIRDARRVRAGAPRAAELSAAARYCRTCKGVFHPSGYPWPGVATPEQFRLHVLSQAGYGDQLDGKAKAAGHP